MSGEVSVSGSGPASESPKKASAAPAEPVAAVEAVSAASSGIAADGSWTPAFPGQRRPFEVGHGLSIRHGANAMLRLAPRAEELAGDLRELVPAASPSDEPTIRLLALVLARVEAANAYLDEHGLFRADGDGEIQPVLKALSTWENTAARLLDRLGCTPVSRASLGLDISRTGDALAAYLEARRAPEEPGS